MIVGVTPVSVGHGWAGRMANQQSDPRRGLAEGQPGPSPAEHHQPAAGGRGPKTDGGEAEDDEAERRTTA